MCVLVFYISRKLPKNKSKITKKTWTERINAYFKKSAERDQDKKVRRTREKKVKETMKRKNCIATHIDQRCQRAIKMCTMPMTEVNQTSSA
jgi:hypothetical protein